MLVSQCGNRNWPPVSFAAADTQCRAIRLRKNRRDARTARKDADFFNHVTGGNPRIPTTARRVLDIGCGRGRLGALLKERQAAVEKGGQAPREKARSQSPFSTSCEVVGIELQPDAAAVARTRLDQVIEQSAEDPALDFPDGHFDCVVCADVLEHLREPAEVLAKIRRWLAPEGVLVASLPNVRHHTVVASLLEGNWTYESAGLLDSDHVRFFTRREIEKLLRRVSVLCWPTRR